MSGDLTNLVARHLEGDREATSLLLGRLEPTMLRVAAAVLHDEIEAEDVVIEVMLQMVPHLDQIAPGALHAYARRAARHACIDLMRRRHRRDSRRALGATVGLGEGGEGTPIEALPAHQTLPEGTVIRRQQDALAAEAVGALSVPVQEAVRLYYGMGHTYHEIAERMDRSRSWVARALLQAREAVAVRVREGDEEGTHGV
jgi:RNA polymerase sigma factor (sigma-70 family)